MRLPLFPLHAVLFPGATIPLQVFEQRYRTMLEHILGGDRRFGIVAIRQGMEVGGHAETFGVGCVAVARSVERAANGTVHVEAAGISRFRIDERLPDDPYPQAIVRALEEDAATVDERMLQDARVAMRRHLAASAAVGGADVPVPAVPADPVAASYAIAAALPLDLRARQALLEAPDAATRLRLATEMARREAFLLEAIGPSVEAPPAPVSLN